MVFCVQCFIIYLILSLKNITTRAVLQISIPQWAWNIPQLYALRYVLCHLPDHLVHHIYNDNIHMFLLQRRKRIALVVINYYAHQTTAWRSCGIYPTANGSIHVKFPPKHDRDSVKISKKGFCYWTFCFHDAMNSAVESRAFVTCNATNLSMDCI